MDDKKYNPLRLMILASLVLYFIYLANKPQNEAVSSQAQPVPVTKPTTCNARIEQVGLSSYELRLRISGAAESIVVYTEQGNLTASTTEVGSAGEYRIRTPGPATAIQIDDCPALNLR